MTDAIWNTVSAVTGSGVGELLPRPTRAEHLLDKYPASTVRKYRG